MIFTLPAPFKATRANYCHSRCSLSPGLRSPGDIRMIRYRLDDNSREAFSLIPCGCTVRRQPTCPPMPASSRLPQRLSRRGWFWASGLVGCIAPSFLVHTQTQWLTTVLTWSDFHRPTSSPSMPSTWSGSSDISSSSTAVHHQRGTQVHHLMLCRPASAGAESGFGIWSLRGCCLPVATKQARLHESMFP
jgi:hypothetical protein